MSDNKEIERIEQAKEYVRRYHEMEEAINVNRDNQEYLSSYIHDKSYVEKEFNFKHKMFESIGVSALAGIVVLLIMFLFASVNFVVSAISCCVVIAVVMIMLTIALKAKLSKAYKEQAETNVGISEQVEIVKAKDKVLCRQRDDYYNGLAERLDFMSLEYMDNIDKIEEIMKNGEADTCEDAAALFEQKMLLQEMTALTSINKKTERKPLDQERAKAMFGDPLELIKQNKKKHKK